MDHCPSKLALDIVPDQRDAILQSGFLVRGIGNDERRHPVDEPNLCFFDRHIRVVTSGLVGLGGNKVEKHFSLGPS